MQYESVLLMRKQQKQIDKQFKFVKILVFSSNHDVNSLLNAAAYNDAFTVYFVDVMLVSKCNIQKWAFLLGFFSRTYTGKSLSKALIFASTNPQYDDRLFIGLQVQYMKIPSSNLGRTCCAKK